MTGGILQLVARGYDDLYIIKEPEITYFKIVYRRHTNFSLFPKVLKFAENVNFGKIGKCRIKLLGDLLHKIYLAIEIPEINITDQYFLVSDLMKIMTKYNIPFTYNGKSTDKLLFYMYDDAKTAIDNYIISLKDQYSKATSAKVKNAIMTELKKIAFKKNNCWYFPDKKELFSQKFNHNNHNNYNDHNNLSFELYDLFQTGKPKFAWVKELAHYLVDYIEVSIDGVIIDKHNSEIIRSDYIINLDENKEEVYNKMIGNIYDLYNYDSSIKPKKLLYLPLRFWFCRHIANALPIVAMPHSPIDIAVKFKKFEEVHFSPYAKIKNAKLNSYLIAQYIFVEEEERKRLCETKLEYLIETFQIGHEEIFTKKNITESKESFEDQVNSTMNKQYLIDYKLNFDFSIKQLFWIAKPVRIKDRINIFDYNFYDTNNNIYNPFDYMKLKFNGRDREVIKHFNYYNLWQPYKHYCSSLVPNLFLYNFALYPQMLQPSGTVNFSQLHDANLNFIFNRKLENMVENNDFSFKVSSYAFSNNILRIFSGMAGLAFQSRAL